jgi:hypothetical protein
LKHDGRPPRVRTERRTGKLYDGHEWQGFAPGEKQAYLAGFLAGAGLMQAEAVAGGVGRFLLVGELQAELLYLALRDINQRMREAEQ